MQNTLLTTIFFPLFQVSFDNDKKARKLQTETFSKLIKRESNVVNFPLNKHPIQKNFSPQKRVNSRHSLIKNKLFFFSFQTRKTFLSRGLNLLN